MGDLTLEAQWFLHLVPGKEGNAAEPATVVVWESPSLSLLQWEIPVALRVRRRRD